MIAAVVNLLGYYPIGIGLGAFLAFYMDLHVLGQWIGIASGSASVSATFLVVIFFLDWRKLAAQAAAKAGVQAADTSSVVASSEPSKADGALEIELAEVVLDTVEDSLPSQQ